MFRIVLIGADGAQAEFSAPGGRSLVKAAAAAGIELTTGCLQGRCAICRVHLHQGRVAALRRPSPNATADPASRADGCVLACSVGALSDLVIEPLSPWAWHETPPPR